MLVPSCEKFKSERSNYTLKVRVALYHIFNEKGTPLPEKNDVESLANLFGEDAVSINTSLDDVKRDYPLVLALADLFLVAYCGRRFKGAWLEYILPLCQAMSAYHPKDRKGATNGPNPLKHGGTKEHFSKAIATMSQKQDGLTVRQIIKKKPEEALIRHELVRHAVMIVAKANGTAALLHIAKQRAREVGLLSRPGSGTTQEAPAPSVSEEDSTFQQVCVPKFSDVTMTKGSARYDDKSIGVFLHIRDSLHEDRLLDRKTGDGPDRRFILSVKAPDSTNDQDDHEGTTGRRVSRRSDGSSSPGSGMQTAISVMEDSDDEVEPSALAGATFAM